MGTRDSSISMLLQRDSERDSLSSPITTFFCLLSDIILSVPFPSPFDVAFRLTRLTSYCDLTAFVTLILSVCWGKRWFSGWGYHSIATGSVLLNTEYLPAPETLYCSRSCHLTGQDRSGAPQDKVILTLFPWLLYKGCHHPLK